MYEREPAVESKTAQRSVITDATRRVRVQRRLVVGSATDPLEVEADRVADDVIRSLRRSPADQPTPGALGLSRRTRIARHAGHDHDHHHDHGAGPEVGREGGEISPGLASRIRSASGGAPLAPRTLARMETGFGASFDRVRVHADSPLAAEVAADAFTTGTDIHFAPGRYAPATSAGEHLLAHELTHVVQQGGAVARHVCDSACSHDRLQATMEAHGLDMDGLLSRSIAEDITPADTGYTVRRHSSWEHMLIGDLDPKSLATLGAQADTKNMIPGARTRVGTDVNGQPIMVGKADVKHVIQQEITRLKKFQATPPMVTTFRAIKATEDQMKADDKQKRVLDAYSAGDIAKANAEVGKEWDLKLLGVPNNHGATFLVTYGEMNTLGDYFGSIEEMKDVDHAWMSKLIRGVRRSTMHELMKVYVQVEGFQDIVDAEGTVIKTERQQARDALGIDSEDFKSASGSKDLVELGGIMNELKLMGLPAWSQQKKPQVGGEAATDYSSTLARNACHFAPESWHAWFDYHMKARGIADRAHQQTLAADAFEARISAPGYQGNAVADQAHLASRREFAAKLANEALMTNGFGDHYMQDSYAAGHLINKTLIMQQYVKWLDKHPEKWDAHRDENWRKVQDMAYSQPGLTDRSQHVKANIRTDRTVRGQQLSSARNPQSVENIKVGDWKTKAEALGLQVPGSISDPNAKRLLVHWQERCVRRAKVRNTRTQTWKTVRTWAMVDLTMSANQAHAALTALFDDGIVRRGSYSTKDKVARQELTLSTDLTLRDEYIPSDQAKMNTAKGSQAAMNDMALGVAYNEYLEFMNSQFLQKATNYVHDKFCLEGLRVKAGNNADVFRIYGDDSMFKSNAGEGLLHSGTTSHMSRDSIIALASTGQAPHTERDILDRLPRKVELDDGSLVGLDVWHHGELLNKLENGIFESMSDFGLTQVKNKGIGLKPGGLGKITASGRPGGHEVFWRRSSTLVHRCVDRAQKGNGLLD